MFVYGSYVCNHVLRERHNHAHTNMTTITRYAKKCTMGITVLLCSGYTGVFQTIFFFLLSGACLKKLLSRKNINGAFGNTWRLNWACRINQIQQFDGIHTLELKLWHFEVSPYICIRRPYVCNVSHPCTT